jgi:aryl-alcohol dehydrogenase-like predicted oxidoreductase
MAAAGDDWEEAPRRRAVERNFRLVAEASAIAAVHGATVAEVALAWLLGTPSVAARIVGPRTLEQLEGLLGATRLALTAEDRARLEAHAAPPDKCCASRPASPTRPSCGDGETARRSPIRPARGASA